MHIVRLVFRWTTSLFLYLSILILFISAIVGLSIGNEQLVKQNIEKSGAYTRFIDAVVAVNAETAADNPSSIPLDDPVIQGLIEKRFSPEFLQATTEGALSGIYDWLDGSSSELLFTADFSEQRDALYQDLANYAVARVDQLEACRGQDLGQTTVFEIPCKPEGYEPDIVYDAVMQDLSQSSLLKEARITQDALPKTTSGENISTAYSFVPLVYQTLNSLYLALAVFIIASVLYVLARLPAHKGLARLGKYYFSNGITIVLFTVIFGYIVPRYTQAFEIQGSETAKVFNDLSDSIVTSIDIAILKISALLLVLSAACFILANIITPRVGYKQLVNQAGLISSLQKKQKISPSDKVLPPVQTSEKTTKSKKKKTPNTYKKLKM